MTTIGGFRGCVGFVSVIGIFMVARIDLTLISLNVLKCVLINSSTLLSEFLWTPECFKDVAGEIRWYVTTAQGSLGHETPLVE